MRGLRNLKYLFLSLVLTGCMNQVGGVGANAELVPNAHLTDSAIAFSSNLQPLLSVNCASCHGSFQAPFIAYENDIQLNHDNVISGGLVNFRNVEVSKLVQQLRSGHNCWTSDCSSDADIMATAIEQWGAARGETIEISGFQTDAVEAPTAATSGFVTMTFDLDSANSDLPSGAQMTIEIRKFDNYSYQFRSPRIITPTNLLVENITILVNGIDGQPNGTYSLIQQSVSANTAPGVSLSSSSVLVGMGLGNGQNPDGTPIGGPGEDLIQIQFQIIEEE